MVPKHWIGMMKLQMSFRAVLFRMVPKRNGDPNVQNNCFRAVLFRMVPKQMRRHHLMA